MIETGIIYCAQNKLNGKIYIGQTVESLEKRKRTHWNDVKRMKVHYFGRALLKYGFEGFEWCILCDVEASTCLLLKYYLDIAEQLYIKQYDSMDRDRGYNCTQGGDGVLGFKHSETSRRKISKARKGYRHTLEAREKMSRSQMGRRHSVETKEKMSRTRIGSKSPMLGRKHSEESKKKISASNSGEKNPMFGKKCSIDRKRKISESLKENKNCKYWFGKKLSDEHRRRISGSLKKFWVRKGINND